MRLSSLSTMLHLGVPVGYGGRLLGAWGYTQGTLSRYILSSAGASQPATSSSSCCSRVEAPPAVNAIRKRSSSIASRAFATAAAGGGGAAARGERSRLKGASSPPEAPKAAAGRGGAPPGKNPTRRMGKRPLPKPVTSPKDFQPPPEGEVKGPPAEKSGGRMNCNIANAHPRDSRLTFDKRAHVYSVSGCEGGPPFSSVTTVIGKYFRPFDPDRIIAQNYDYWQEKPHPEYGGMSKEEIKEKWASQGKEAAALGTGLHEEIEQHYLEGSEGVDSSGQFRKELELFANFERDFVRKRNLKPFRVEWRMYDEEARMAGTVDMLYEDAEGNLIMCDWKRSKQLNMDNTYQTGTHSLTRTLGDCNYVRYSLQLHIYRYILAKHYGRKVTGCWIVALHPDQDQFIALPAQTSGGMREAVEGIFRERTAKFAAAVAAAAVGDSAE